MKNDLYIADRFRKAVTLHILKNQFTNSHRIPLILGIHGRSGNGKTYQCEQILDELNVKSFLISGGELESEDAGKPAKLIRTTYLEAGDAIDNGECSLAVILINDIDTGLGSWGEMVQYTINRQTVFGELMHLVDYPNQVDNYKTHRIPIIMTGNDFSKLYEPLVRAGRMTSFLWNPTVGEKARMIQNIFSNLSIDEIIEVIKNLENTANEELTISFFAHLKNSLYDDILWDLIQEKGIDNILLNISNGEVPNIDENLNVKQIIEIGSHLLTSGQLINHLKD